MQTKNKDNMKLYNKLVLGSLCLAFALASCSREECNVEDLPQSKSFSGFTTIAGMQFKEVKEYGAEKSEARSLITRTENDIPTMTVNYLNEGLSIRTVVYRPDGSGISKLRVWDIKDRNTTYNPDTNMGTGYTILNDDGSVTPDGNRGTHLAVSVNGGTDKFKAGDHTYMVLGGIVYSSSNDVNKVKQCFGYNGQKDTQAEKRYNDPNAVEGSDGATHKRLILAAHGSELSLPYPLTTQVREINGINPQRILGTNANGFNGNYVNWVKLNPTRFHARGSLLGFKITNNTEFKLKIEELVVMNMGNGSPFSTKGYFTPIGKGNFGGRPNMLKYVSDGGTEDMERTYNLENTSGVKGFDLEANASTNGRFYFWGYPVAPAKALDVKITYKFYDVTGTNLQTTLRGSIVQRIPAPGSWADGGYYRINLKLKKFGTDPAPWTTVDYLELQPSDIGTYSDEGVFQPDQVTDAN